MAAMLLICYCYWSAAAMLLMLVCYCCWFAAGMLLLLLDLLLPAGPWNPKKVRTPTSLMQPTKQPFSSEKNYRIIKPSQRTEIAIIDEQVVKARPGEDEIARRYKTYHPHDLELKSTRSLDKCSGCKELGFGDRYVCEHKRCRYFLHPDCMFYKETRTHDFLHGSNFKFHQKPFDKKNRYCDACGMCILGFVYRCKKGDKVLHPCCLNLWKMVSIDDNNFQLRRSKKDLRLKCCYCNSKNKKDNRDKCWYYSSEKQDHHAHVYCMKEVLLNYWRGGGGGGGGGNGAMVLVNRKKKLLKALKLVGKLLETVLSMLMGNPTPLITVLELFDQ